MKRLALAVTVLTALPAAASAAPTLINPSAESIAQDRPLYTWTFATTDERASVLHVATSPGTTPEGELYEEDRVTFGIITPDTATSWQDASKLAAGTYWWNLRWNTADYTTTGYTAPLSFTTPAYVRNARVSVTQYDYIADRFPVSYATNAKVARARCDLKHGRTHVRTMRAVNTFNTIGGRSSVTCQTVIPARLRGKTLRVLAEVTAGGVKGSAVKVFVARR